MVGQQYSESIIKWRAQREASISAPYGWLSTAGLFWLQQGENPLGSNPTDPIHLPLNAGSAEQGSFFLEGDQVRLVSLPGCDVFMDGERIRAAQIHFEDDSSPEIRIGELKLFVIRRGSRYGVRIFNPQNPGRLAFSGLNWFPVSEEYVFQADFKPFHAMRKIQIVNVLGDLEEMDSPGLLELTLQDRPCNLLPVLSGDRRFWLIFRDRTNGSDTYPGGRFLMVDEPIEGKTVVDFNKAYNPPCAYTEFATCPLPPPENRIDFPINAGEKKYHP